MEHKTLYAVLALLTLAAVVGVIFLLHGEVGEEGITEDDAAVAVPEEDAPQAEDIQAVETLREPVVPEEIPPEEPGVMPDSYRRALGGIKGRVVESDGQPVPDIKVEIFGVSALELFLDGMAFMDDEPPKFEFKADSTRTGDDGTFRLENLYTRAIHVLGIDLKGPRATSRIVDANPGPGETVDLGDIVLSPYAVLFGKVVDDAGEPVAGARVRATQLPPIIFTAGIQDFRAGCSFLVRGGSEQMVFDTPDALQQFFDLLPVPTTESKGDGAFRLEGVPLGLLSVVADRSGLVSSYKGPVSTARGGEKDVGELTVDRGVVLKGKVVDHLGEPVPGVEVRVGTMHGVAEMIILQPPVATDEEGAFTCPGMAPRSTFAVARRFEEDPWTVAGPFHPEYEPPVLTLPPAFDLRLLITKADGTPARGARVKMREQGPMGNMLVFHPPIIPRDRMSSPEEGVIDIQGLAKGTYEFLVTAPDCGMTKETVTVRESGMEKEVILEPAYKARVRILTEKGNHPVEWAQVHASLSDEAWFLNPVKLSRGRTDAAGLVELRGLCPGDYKVSVSHPGFAVTAGALTVPNPEETVILVKPGGILEGVVHRGGSTHEAPFMISLFLDTWSGTPEAQTPRITATDLEGRFRVTNMNPGNWQVAVLKRLLDQDPLGMGEVMRMGPLVTGEVEVWSEETSYLELNLEGEDLGPTAAVTGRVFVDRKPAVGARLTLRAKRKRFEATVDASGNYDLGQVPVGSHTLRLVELPAPMGQYDINLRRRIEVVEGVPSYEDFSLLTGVITGRVIYEDDAAPVRGVRVRARINEEDAPYAVGMSTVTDLDGAFLLEGVPVGIYTVNAEERRFGSKAATGVKVYPGGSSGAVLITLVTPVAVEGRVELPEGAGSGRWLGMSIQSAGDQGGQEWVTVNKETGMFKTTRLIPGSYQATLYGDMKEKYKPMEFDVPPGGVTNLVLVPEPDTSQESTVEKK